MRNGVAILMLLTSLQGSIAAANELACDGKPKSSVPIPSPGANQKYDPPPGIGPTQIDIGFQLLALSDIDFIASRFRVEGYGDFVWCDPRQAFDAIGEERDTRVFFGEGNGPEDLWIADVSVANTVGDTVVTDRRLEVRSDGRIRISAFFNAVVSARYDLRRFPFDRQSLDIAMESFSFNRDVVELRPVADRVGFDRDIFLQEWRVLSVDSRAMERLEVRDRVPFSRAVFSVSIQRESGYYLWKLSVPLILIVMLSWTVFWMKDESLGGRIRITLTAFLTIVAYQFAISGDLPKVGYLTLMDKMMVASFVLIALSALENMVAVLVSERNPEVGHQIDLHSRWLFPILYVTVVVAVAALSA